MTEPNKSKNLANLPAAPPRRLQTGVATLEPGAPPPKPVLPGRRQDSAVPAPLSAHTIVDTPESAALPPVLPAAPANPAPAPKRSNAQKDSVTIHTFEELLADLDLLTPSTEAPVEAPPPPAFIEEVAPTSRLEEAVPQRSKPRAGRTQRIPLGLPVLVRGRVGAHNAIREETRTLFVLARGAILTLSARVSSGETVSLINLSSGKEARCDVMDVQSNASGKNQVELQFCETTPGFWPISFPIEDADDRRRPMEDAKAAGSSKPFAPLPAAPSFSNKPSSVAPLPVSSVKSIVNPAAAMDSVKPATEPVFHPAGDPSSASSHVIDLTTLILADEPGVAEVRPAAIEKAPKNLRTPPPEDELPSTLSQVTVSSPALDLPVEVAPNSRDAFASQAWSAGDSKKGKTWLILSVAAALLVAGVTAGTFYLRHRASNAQSIAASSKPPVTPAAGPSVTQTIVPGSEAANSGSTQPGNSTVGGTSKSTGLTSTPNSTNAASKAPSKNAVETPNPSASASAPAASAPGKSKKPAGRLTASMVPTARPAAQNQEVVAPSIGSAVPAGMTSVLVSGSPLSQPSAPLPAGGQVQAARVLSTVNPEYPVLAHRNRVEGDVVLQAEIDGNGKITKTKVISGPALLQQAALDALRQWKFAPGMLNGQPTVTQMSVTIKFRL